MLKIDLHTHSTASPDGSITKQQYHLVLESGKLDYIAITDHNTAQLALELQAELGDKIIAGEEIMTEDGEIIGLYLKKTIAPGKSAKATMQAIKEQGGLVYIPHPLETRRKGLNLKTLQQLGDFVDVVEIHNPRAAGSAFSGRERQRKIMGWLKASDHSIALATSSDAHGIKALGSNYIKLSQKPTPQNLTKLINGGELVVKGAKIIDRLYPSLSRLRKRFVK